MKKEVKIYWANLFMVRWWEIPFRKVEFWRNCSMSPTGYVISFLNVIHLYVYYKKT